MKTTKAIKNSWGEAQLYHLQNGNVSLTVSSLGATLISLQYPNRNGVKEEITLNHVEEATPNEYLQKNRSYLGSTVGRFANRIANGTFVLDGKEYTLPVNNGPNCLHGGNSGFDKRLWKGKLMSSEDNVLGPGDVGVEFTLKSHDMDEGFPGNVVVSVKYILTHDDRLKFLYEASTDKETVINLTNHTYWNLSGNFKRKIDGHCLTLYCSDYLPVDSLQIPTGKIEPVANSSFDFTSNDGTLLGKCLLDVDGGGEPGFDHCFVVSNWSPDDPDKLSEVAVVTDTLSGRRMCVSSNQPGVQIYTGNFLSKDLSDFPFCKHMAICLETQGFPNSPNNNSFPSSTLKPGDTYVHQTIHSFSLI